MRTYAASSASYAGAVDMLYVLINPNGDMSAGITVMYDRRGAVIGAEVPDFSERFSLPAMIPVDSHNPFAISVDNAAGLTEA